MLCGHLPQFFGGQPRNHRSPPPYLRQLPLSATHPHRLAAPHRPVPEYDYPVRVSLHLDADLNSDQFTQSFSRRGRLMNNPINDVIAFHNAIQSHERYDWNHLLHPDHCYADADDIRALLQDFQSLDQIYVRYVDALDL